MRPYLATTYPTWDALTNAAAIQPVFFVTIDFGTPSYKLMTSFYSDDLLFTPSPLVQGLTFPKESLRRESASFTVTVTGLDATLLNYALNARQDLNYPTSDYDIPFGSIDLWFFNADGTVGEDASLPIASGLMDGCEIAHGPDQTVVVFTFAHSDDWAWERPIEGRYTDGYQRSLTSVLEDPLIDSFADDAGFEFVERLQDWSGFWAKPPAAKKPGKNKTSKKGRGGKRT